MHERLGLSLTWSASGLSLSGLGIHPRDCLVDARSGQDAEIAVALIPRVAQHECELGKASWGGVTLAASVPKASACSLVRGGRLREAEPGEREVSFGVACCRGACVGGLREFAQSLLGLAARQASALERRERPFVVDLHVVRTAVRPTGFVGPLAHALP